MNKYCQVFVIFLLLIVFLLSLLLTSLGSFLIYTYHETKGNCTPLLPIEKFSHRSWTKDFQENTKEGIMATIEHKIGAEFDLLMISTGDIVIFHDHNALKKTGTDLKMSDATLDQVKQLNYKTTINNYKYSESRKVPFLKETIIDLCKKNPIHPLDLDIKFSLKDENAKILFDILDDSPCKCNENQKIVFATPFFQEIPNFRKFMNTRRCKGKISLWFHPNTLPLGEYIWLKTKFSIFIGSPDIVSSHYKIWGENPELLHEINSLGFCTAVYGNNEESLKNFPVNSYKVVDVSDASLEKISYKSQGVYFNWYFGIYVISGLVFISSFIMIIGNCCRCCKGDQNDKKTYNIFDDL